MKIYTSLIRNAEFGGQIITHKSTRDDVISFTEPLLGDTPDANSVGLQLGMQVLQ